TITEGRRRNGRLLDGVARLLELIELQDLDLDFGLRLALAVFHLLLFRQLLLATDPLKRLLHVRIEARTVTEVGIENMFHAVSCVRSGDCFKAGAAALQTEHGLGGLSGHDDAELRRRRSYDRRRRGRDGAVLQAFLRSLRIAASCAASIASSPSTVAISCLSFAWRRASSARLSASLALASSRSAPRIAVSASTVMSLGCTSRMPPATKMSC